MALPATPGAAPKAVAPASYGQPLPWHFHRVVQALNALGTLWIVALMLLINTDVLGRNLLGAPVRGVTELVSLSIVGIVFLQLADTLHSGRITRADVLLHGLQRTRPVLAAALHAAFHLVGAVLMGVGGVVAMGCTIGQGLSALSTLSLGSFLAVAGIVAGAVVALRYQSWQLERQT